MSKSIKVTFENGSIYDGFASTFTDTTDNSITYYFSFDKDYRVQVQTNVVTLQQYRNTNGAWYDIDIISAVTFDNVGVTAEWVNKNFQPKGEYVTPEDVEQVVSEQMDNYVKKSGDTMQGELTFDYGIDGQITIAADNITFRAKGDDSHDVFYVIYLDYDMVMKKYVMQYDYHNIDTIDIVHYSSDAVPLNVVIPDITGQYDRNAYAYNKYFNFTNGNLTVLNNKSIKFYKTNTTDNYFQDYTQIGYDLLFFGPTNNTDINSVSISHTQIGCTNLFAKFVELDSTLGKIRIGSGVIDMFANAYIKFRESNEIGANTYILNYKYMDNLEELINGYDYLNKSTRSMANSLFYSQSMLDSLNDILNGMQIGQGYYSNETFSGTAFTSGGGSSRGGGVGRHHQPSAYTPTTDIVVPDYDKNQQWQLDAQALIPVTDEIIQVLFAVSQGSTISTDDLQLVYNKYKDWYAGKYGDAIATGAYVGGATKSSN